VDGSLQRFAAFSRWREVAGSSSRARRRAAARECWIPVAIAAPVGFRKDSICRAQGPKRGLSASRADKACIETARENHLAAVLITFRGRRIIRSSSHAGSVVMISNM
jgi:hypothetical protein